MKSIILFRHAALVAASIRGILGCRVEHGMTSPPHPNPLPPQAAPAGERGQRGNIFTVLLGGIVLSGTLSIALYQLMGGPIFSTVKLAKQTAAEAQAQTVMRRMIADAGNETLNATTGIAGDCDADGMVEPKAFRKVSGWSAAQTAVHPTNGGNVPLTAGASVTDPWGTDYGYCIWDVGAHNDPAVDNGCGAAVARLQGSPTPTAGSSVSQTIVAVISAGEDRTFQTTCNAYTNGTTNLITTTGGSDDIVTRLTYAEAATATSAVWSLKKGTPDIAASDKSMVVGTSTAHKALSASNPVSAFSVATTGKVVSGGAVSLGNESSIGDGVCTASRIGLMRYNTTANSGAGGVQFCTPSGWSNVGSGGPGTPDPGNHDHIDGPSGGLSDAVADYVTLNYLGMGLGALKNPSLPTGAPSTTYNAITLTQGPSAIQRMGNNTATTATGQSYVMDGGGGRLAAPSSGGTIIVSVSATNATGSSAIAVTDTTTNVVAGSTTHTFTAAKEVISCDTSKGTAGIYFYTYASAPGNTTITVKPVTNASSITWSISEYANVNAANSAAALDLTPGQDISTASNVTSSTVNMSGTTLSAGELGIAVSTHCPLVDTSGTAFAVNASGSSPASWTQDYSENSNPAGGSQYANGAAARQIFGSAVTNPAHAWTFGSGGTTQPRGYASAMAIFKTTTSATSLPVYATAAGYNTLGKLTTGANNTALGNSALAAATTSANDTAAGYNALAAVTTGTGNNLAIGSGAAAATTTGIYNTVIGKDSFNLNTTGSYDTAIGYQAFPFAAATVTTTSNNALAIGYQALNTHNVIQPATAIGYQALKGGAGGQNVTAFGSGAGEVQGVSSTAAFGYQAFNDNGATDSVAFGSAALKGGSGVSTTSSTAFGYHALTSAQSAATANTAFGYNALAANVSDSQNVAFGYSALAAANTGSTATGHTAFGYNALASNTTGSSNTAFGYSALSGNTTGTGNVAFGYNANATGTPTGSTAFGFNALSSNSGTGNTALGYQALKANTSGNYNTAFGYNALLSNTIGDRNTAVGALSLQANTTGTDNTAVGYQALYSNIGGNFNTAAGYQALYSSQNDNDNTAVGYQALYTNNGGSANTAVGDSALYANTTGSNNTASGYQAMMNNTTGAENTAEGALALKANTTGSGNTVSGYQAMLGSTTGSYNVAWGANALAAANPVSNNVAFGYNALNQTSSDAQVAVGYEALYNGGSGGHNVGIGNGALYTSDADADNTAIGYHALYVNDGGSNNTAIGNLALSSNTTGDGNTAIGDSALSANTTGSNNTAIGYGAGPDPGTGCGGSPCTNLSNTTAIGYQAYVTASNTVMLGNSSVTLVGGYSALNALSDRRAKTDIADSDLGLDFIMKLKPVSYRRIGGDGRLDYGFIAQDVQKALGDRDTKIVEQQNDPVQTWFMSKSELLAPIVKAIQEQKIVEDRQKTEIVILKERLEKLKAVLKTLRQRKDAQP